MLKTITGLIQSQRVAGTKAWAVRPTSQSWSQAQKRNRGSEQSQRPNDQAKSQTRQSQESGLKVRTGVREGRSRCVSNAGPKLGKQRNRTQLPSKDAGTKNQKRVQEQDRVCLSSRSGIWLVAQSFLEFPPCLNSACRPTGGHGECCYLGLLWAAHPVVPSLPGFTEDCSSARATSWWCGSTSHPEPCRLTC